MKALLLLLLVLLSAFTVHAQNGDSDPVTSVAHVRQLVAEGLKSKWYEKIQLRGYADFRYNRIGETNNQLTCTMCDGSLGGKQGFFFRRARLTLFGEITDRIFIYIQPDYSTSAVNTTTGSSQQNYLQLRDAYFDYALDDQREFRIRTGLSKVPYGFDNMQSSANRAALDRDDALNSATPNERDMGVYMMWAPDLIRKRFKELTNANLKGSGDYGVIAVGTYNGQSMNRAERNNDLHRVIRATYPMKLKSGQFVEASLQAYEGSYNVERLNGNLLNRNYYDQRSAASLIWYPQPFGFQAEYNIGRGPEYDPHQDKVRVQNLKGGYAQVNYMLEHKGNRYFPYARYQEYQGGKKYEVTQEARSHRVRELEIGTEWQPNPAFELTAAYAMADRTTQSSSTNRLHAKGSLVRLQAQFNY